MKYSVYKFAELAGISPQWVYKQLKDGGELSKYVIRQDGKIRINADALALYSKEDPQKEHPADNVSDDLMMALRDQIQTLKDQLQVKDQQIEQLQDTIRAELQLRMAAERRISLLEAPEDIQTENTTPKQKAPSEGKIGGSERMPGSAQESPQGLSEISEPPKKRVWQFWKWR